MMVDRPNCHASTVPHCYYGWLQAPLIQPTSVNPSVRQYIRRARGEHASDTTQSSAAHPTDPFQLTRSHHAPRTTHHAPHPHPTPPHPTSRTTFAAQFKAFSLLRCASHRFDHPCSPSHPPPCRHRRPLSCSRRSPFHCSSSHSLLSLLPSTSHLPALPTVRVPPRKQVELEMIKNKNWKKKEKKKYLAKKKSRKKRN